jgi:hypothetical protein
LHGWGGGIRTPECWYQKPVPYHLATPHHEFAPLRLKFRQSRNFESSLAAHHCIRIFIARSEVFKYISLRYSILLCAASACKSVVIITKRGEKAYLFYR